MGIWGKEIGSVIDRGNGFGPLSEFESTHEMETFSLSPATLTWNVKAKATSPLQCSDSTQKPIHRKWKIIFAIALLRILPQINYNNLCMVYFAPAYSIIERGAFRSDNQNQNISLDNVNLISTLCMKIRWTVSQIRFGPFGEWEIHSYIFIFYIMLLY